MNHKPTSAWIHGLVASVFTGIGNGITLSVANAAFDIFKDTRSFWIAVVAATLTSVGAYLKQSPLPYYEFEGGKIEDPEVNPRTMEIKPVIMPLLMILILPFMSLSCVTAPDGSTDVPRTVENVKPYVRPASSAIGVSLMIVAKEGESKVERARWLLAVSTTIKAISSDTPPTVDEMRRALATITPSDQDDWAQVAASVVSLYSGLKTQFKSDTKAVLELVSQIALGLEDAAAPYARIQ